MCVRRNETEMNAVKHQKRHPKSKPNADEKSLTKIQTRYIGTKETKTSKEKRKL